MAKEKSSFVVNPSDTSDTARPNYDRAIGYLNRLGLDVRKAHRPFTVETETGDDGSKVIVITIEGVKKEPAVEAPKPVEAKPVVETKPEEKKGTPAK